ncbi:MAG: TIGR02147 family protein [Bdellovibrionales bacterium]|nr:TIGR02147 family protein [Bdellovibrionales bacterium]
MKKLISSIFQYNDYRVLLLDDFTKRSTLNKRYSLRAYARDLELSSGHLSSVLKGRKSLNLTNYKSIFSKIGFIEEKEFDYAEKLVIYKITDNQILREEALDYINKHYESLRMKDHSERDGIINSAKHLIIYMTISRISDCRTVEKVADSFGISTKCFKAITDELICLGYIKKEGKNFFAVDKNVAITASPKILGCAAELSELLFANMKENGGINFPLKSTHSLIMGFDDDSFHQAIEVYKQFLHQIYRISQNTKSINKITIFTDILTTTVIENT